MSSYICQMYKLVRVTSRATKLIQLDIHVMTLEPKQHKRKKKELARACNKMHQQNGWPGVKEKRQDKENPQSLGPDTLDGTMHDDT